MELRQLNYFIAISDAKSFTRAAEKLYVSQPALTGQINALENELGMKLFDRTNKFVQLTPAGEVFYKHATQVLSEVENTLSHVQTIRQNEQGTLCFAVHPIFSGAPFLAIHRAVQARFPNQRLLFDISDPRGIDSGQNRRRNCFQVLPELADPSASGQVLAESPFVLAAMDSSTLSDPDKMYLLPGSSRLWSKLTELLPDDAPISTFFSLDNALQYLALSDAAALLPRAIVPANTVYRELSGAPRLGILLKSSDEQMQKALAAVLRKALLDQGWE